MSFGLLNMTMKPVTKMGHQQFSGLSFMGASLAQTYIHLASNLSYVGVPGESTPSLKNLPFRRWYTTAAGAISHATLE